MTDKELHRNTLIFAGIVILALILWAYMHRYLQNFLSPAAQPDVNQAGPVAFEIMGAPSVTGPLSFPTPIFNIPPLPPNGIYSPSSCECGCMGGNAGPITYTFPDTASLFDALSAADNAALENTINAVVGAMPYDAGVFTENGQPLPGFMA